MALYGADYEVFCGSIKRREGEREEISTTINNGPMPTSRAWDFSQCTKPMRKRADPDEETIDRRAVCGRTARPVRREGRVWKGLFSTPIVPRMVSLNHPWCLDSGNPCRNDDCKSSLANQEKRNYFNFLSDKQNGA